MGTDHIKLLGYLSHTFALTAPTKDFQLPGT